MKKTQHVCLVCAAVIAILAQLCLLATPARALDDNEALEPSVLATCDQPCEDADEGSTEIVAQEPESTAEPPAIAEGVSDPSVDIPLPSEDEAVPTPVDEEPQDSVLAEQGSEDDPAPNPPAAMEVDAPQERSVEARAQADVAGSTEPVAVAQPVSALTEVTVATLSQPGNNDKVLDLSRASAASDASFLMYQANSMAHQRFRFEPVAGTQYCAIYSVSTDKALAVDEVLTGAGGLVYQRAYTGALTQHWIVAQGGEGAYRIYSAQALDAGLALVLSLDAQLRRLVVWDITSDKAGRWVIRSTRTVADGTYTLAPNVSADRVLDLTRGALARGTNIESYAPNSSNAQRFYASYDTHSGYYTICNVASGHVLDVSGSSAKSGANVSQWSLTGNANQQWSIEKTSSGTYRIVARHSGKVLSVKGSGTANGTNVVQATDTAARGQRWRLTSVNPLADGCYTIAAFASQGLCVDVRGGVGERYTNVFLYKKNGGVAQKLEILHYGKGYYTIRTLTSGLYVGVLNASATPGSNVCIEGGVELTDGHLWKPVPSAGGLSFVSASGLAFDISRGVMQSGTNIIGWTPSGTKNQHFVLAKTSDLLIGLTQIAAVVPTKTPGTLPQVASARIGGKTYLFLPSCVDKTRVQLRYAPTRLGKQAEVASAQGGSYTLLAQDGTINLTKGFKRDATGAYIMWVRSASAGYTRQVLVMVSSGIRSMYLASDDPVNKGRGWVDAAARTSKRATSGSMVLLGKDGKVTYDGKLTQIKGRGNSTWEMTKKPYQIKLDKKTSLLDGTDANKAKTWVLLANYLDTTMERNYLAQKLALELGLAQSPDCGYVDLYYDGVYRGTYLLSEKAQIGKGRVDIYDLEEENEKLNGDTSSHKTAQGKNSLGQTFQYVQGIKNPSDITGGYLIEMESENYKEERCWFKTTAGYFVVKGPEDASYDQVKYISEYVQRTINEAGKASGKLSQYLNVTSLAKVTLVNEVTKNPDWIVWSSTYFYKDKGGRLCAGPVWDFDLSCGVARQDEVHKFASMATEGFIHKEYGFFGNNNQFKSALKTTYTENVAKVKALVSGGSSGKGKVGDTAKLLGDTWQMNRVLWPYKSTVYVPLNLSQRDNATEHLWYWLAARSNWLNNYFTGSKQALVNLGSALSGTFTIKAGTGRMLFVEKSSNANGADIVTWSSNGSKYQKFKLTAIGKNESGEWYYTITNVGSGKVLAAEGGSTRLTTNVCQEKYNASAGQYWILRRTSPASTGRYQIVNLKSRLSLDVGGGDNYNGAGVLLYLLSGNNAAQNWTLKKA